MLISLYIADPVAFVLLYGQAMYDELNATYGFHVIEEP